MKRGGRLAEVLGVISLAAARARGQAAESILGTSIISTRLARHFGMSEERVTDTYYTAVTRTLGCTSTAMDAAPLAFGDDITFNYALNISDFANPATIRQNLERHWAVDVDPVARQRAIAHALEVLPQLAEVPLAHGYQATTLARRLPVSAAVSDLLSQVDARWDGMNPYRPAGEEIPLPIRIIEFALVAEMYRRAGGLLAMLELVESRSGAQFDPKVCEVFTNHTGDILEGLDANSLWDLFLDIEPGQRLHLEAHHMTAVAEVTADFADNKSGWTVGHSRIAADVATTAAEHIGLSQADQSAVQIAGLMHDIGRCAVPNGVWDKPGELSDGERRLAESHSRHTEEILASSGALRSSAAIAAAVHERNDGSGYHHGVRVRDIKSQLLSAADIFAALTQDRPWRDALADDEAAEILSNEARAGRLRADAVAGVLGSMGHRTARAGQEGLAGLTPRERQVLAHLAQGMLTKQIAAKLGVAYKTADNHIQNIYKKIGASSRTAAAMYAMEHGLYDS